MLRLTLDLETFDDIVTKHWTKVALGMRKKILELISQSKNADGQPLHPYSSKYKSWKTRKGLSGRVDFRVSGEYLASIKYKATVDGFAVYVSGGKSNQKGRALEAKRNWQLFRWGRALEKELDVLLQQMLKDLGL